MSRTTLVLVAAATFAGAALDGQELPKNAPHFVKSQKAPGVDVRFLDFKWDPEAFASLEKGGDHAVGRRSWALARLLLQEAPMKWEGRTIPVGPSLLIVNPAQGGQGATLELRRVDMRDIFTNLNVIAEPPPGETYQKVPAVFEKADTVADRLEVSLEGGTGDLHLTVHIGDRRATIVLKRS